MGKNKDGNEKPRKKKKNVSENMKFSDTVYQSIAKAVAESDINKTLASRDLLANIVWPSISSTNLPSLDFLAGLGPNLISKPIEPIIPTFNPPIIPQIDLEDIEWNPRVQNNITVTGNNNNTSGVFGDNNTVSFSVSEDLQTKVDEIKNLLKQITSKPFDNPLYVQATALRMELDSTELNPSNQSYILQRLRSFGDGVAASLAASFIFPEIAQPLTDLVASIGSLPLG